MQALQVGSAIAQPGKIVYGAFQGIDLPTGGSDDIPVIIAQGTQPGSTLWVTGSIHGNEYSGLSAILKLLGVNGADLPLERMKGTLVLIPTLSPAGIRIGQRAPYYNWGSDPNRMFPDMKTETESEEEDTSAALERVYARLFDVIERSADYLIDLHNAVIGSLGFSFRDPIYYTQDYSKEQAEQLMSQIDAMLDAFGMPVLNEFPSGQYLSRNLHRSVSGAVVNRARKPAFTVELGGYDAVDALLRDAAVVGIRNVMRWAGMLDSEREPMPPIPFPQVDFAVRRKMHPRVPRAGFITHLVSTGDVFQTGDALARLTDIYGRPLGDDDGLLRSEHDGYVVGWLSGIVYYENEPCLWLAVRDESAMILPHPDLQQPETDQQ